MPTYTLYYPADKQITELSEKVQHFIQELGKVSLRQEIDLTGKTDTHSKNILTGIQAEGAYRVEKKPEFTESVVPPSEVPGGRR